MGALFQLFSFVKNGDNDLVGGGEGGHDEKKKEALKPLLRLSCAESFLGSLFFFVCAVVVYVR